MNGIQTVTFRYIIVPDCDSVAELGLPTIAKHYTVQQVSLCTGCCVQLHEPTETILDCILIMYGRDLVENQVSLDWLRVQLGLWP
jgi:hypothetical protein